MRSREAKSTLFWVKDLQAIFTAARLARENAYAPYSGFKVGAAARIIGGDGIVAACNVENASFGATVCAERNVVFQTIAQTGGAEIDDLVLVTDADPPAVPCALCLQVLQEFCPPEFTIHIANLSGIVRSLTLGDLLPIPFSSF